MRKLKCVVSTAVAGPCLRCRKYVSDGAHLPEETQGFGLYCPRCCPVCKASKANFASIDDSRRPRGKRCGIDRHEWQLR
jgi:hypothetical protein